MADVATVFGWSPQVMGELTLAELLGWHARALKRHNPDR